MATDLSSAPVLLGQRRAMRSNRIPRSTLMLFSRTKHQRQILTVLEGWYLRAWIRNICARPSLSGRENSIRRSIRPGRNNAGSSVSGLRLCSAEVLY